MLNHLMTLKVGVSQIQNNLDVQQNLETILACIAKHQKTACDLALFPECSLSGFTSLIKNTDFSEIAKAFKKIQHQVDQGTTAAFVPSGLKNENGEFVNSGFYFAPMKNPVQFFKEGLTESEQRFFKSSSNECRFIEIKDYKISFLICIEAAHEPWRYFSENEKPDFILWPAYWGRDEVPKWDDTLGKDSLKVFQNNKLWGTPILHATYFENHENVGIKPGPFGQSMVIQGDNSLYYSAAKSKAEDFVVMLEKTSNQNAVVTSLHTS